MSRASNALVRDPGRVLCCIGCNCHGAVDESDQVDLLRAERIDDGCKISQQRIERYLSDVPLRSTDSSEVGRYEGPRRTEELTYSS